MNDAARRAWADYHMTAWEKLNARADLSGAGALSPNWADLERENAKIRAITAATISHHEVVILRSDLAQAKIQHSWQQAEIARLQAELSRVSHLYNTVRAPARAETPPGFPIRALKSPRQSVGLITERG